MQLSANEVCTFVAHPCALPDLLLTYLPYALKGVSLPLGGAKSTNIAVSV